jgi:hypothetical protein
MTRPSTSARGYGWAHQKLRARLIQRMRDGDPCAECALPMWHGTPLDLCHDHDNGGYKGLGHASCNRSEGASRGNRDRLTTTHHARDW